MATIKSPVTRGTERLELSIVFLVQPAGQSSNLQRTKCDQAALTRTQVRQILVLCYQFRTWVKFCLVHKMLHFGANPGLGAVRVRVLSIDDR